MENQAQYIRAPDAWMLSSFVLSIDQFEAAGEQLSQFDPKHPLVVSALGPRTDGAFAFLDALEDTVSAIRLFSANNSDLVSVKQLEMPLPLDTTLDVLKEVRELVGDLKTFWETSPDSAKSTIALLAEHNAGAGQQPLGYKLRTGGITADAFPTSEQIAKALVAFSAHPLPIKFTAGLHHPLRQFRDEVKAKMHGFLNVLGAAVLVAEHRWDEQQTADMLDDEDANAFSFDDQFFAWREWKIDITRLSALRKLVVSFGSCSFDEPREDLRALKFL